VLELLIELGNALFEQPLLAVDLDPAEPLGRQMLEDVLVLALAVAHDRSVDGEAGAGLQLEIWSTIDSWLWPEIGRPQTGQCGLPIRA
jgi:hypothetical protein